MSTRAGIATTLRTLADKQDLAVLFVTHDLGEAVRLCDRITVLNDGMVVESGTPRGLVASPAHPYTAELLGAEVTTA